MTASAVLVCENTRGRNQLTRMRSHGQFVLRPTIPVDDEPWVHHDPAAARVSLSAGAAGPLGGDHLRLQVRVGPGATLVLGEVSATLALPGPHGQASLVEIDVHLGEDATLVWLPQPIIAAAGCLHHQRVRIDAAASARLFLRERLLAGRHEESPGNILQELRLTRAQAPVLHTTFSVGDRVPGWDGPAVSGGNRAVGNMVIVDPGSGLGEGRSDIHSPNAFTVGLDADTVQTSAVAPTSVALDEALDEALGRIGAPWAPPRQHEPVDNT